jgi:hypothetical protein
VGGLAHLGQSEVVSTDEVLEDFKDHLRRIVNGGTWRVNDEIVSGWFVYEHAAELLEALQ